MRVVDERFEVELEARPARRRGAARRGAAAARPSGPVTSPGLPLGEPGAAPPSGDDPSGGGAPPPRRPATIAVAVMGALALLAVGWAFGRATGDTNSVADDADPSSTVATTEPAPSTTAPGVALPRPRPTTTTTEPPPDRLLMTLAPRLLGAPSGLELVGLSADGDLVSVDLDSGVVSVTHLPGAPNRLRPVAGMAYVVPLASETIVVYLDGSPPYIVPRGGVARLGEGRFGGEREVVVSGDSLWLLRYREVTMEIEPVDVAGEPLGSPVELPAASVHADGRGGLLVDAPGGVYQLDAGGVTRISSGEPVAIGRNHVLVSECDESLACDAVLIDRQSGVRTAPAVESLPAYIGLFWRSEPSISPDGSAVVLWRPTEREGGFAVVDLVTGDETPIDLTLDDAPQVVWSDDSRFVVFIGFMNRVRFIDRLTGETGELPDDVPDLVTMRPRSTAAVQTADTEQPADVPTASDAVPVDDTVAG